ncbi:MAG: SDR family NAD(P)-dependent oxidoreductase [Nitrososphaeraceae archaeon]
MGTKKRIRFSSSVIAMAFPTYGAYTASKAGVEGLVRVLAKPLAQWEQSYFLPVRQRHR